jgi:hypothetical protein
MGNPALLAACGHLVAQCNGTTVHVVQRTRNTKLHRFLHLPGDRAALPDQVDGRLDLLRHRRDVAEFNAANLRLDSAAVLRSKIIRNINEVCLADCLVRLGR